MQTHHVGDICISACEWQHKSNTDQPGGPSSNASSQRVHDSIRQDPTSSTRLGQAEWPASDSLPHHAQYVTFALPAGEGPHSAEMGWGAADRRQARLCNESQGQEEASNTEIHEEVLASKVNQSVFEYECEYQRNLLVLYPVGAFHCWTPRAVTRDIFLQHHDVAMKACQSILFSSLREAPRIRRHKGALTVCCMIGCTVSYPCLKSLGRCLPVPTTTRYYEYSRIFLGPYEDCSLFSTVFSNFAKLKEAKACLRWTRPRWYKNKNRKRNNDQKTPTW